MAGSAWTNQVQSLVIVAGPAGTVAGVFIYNGTPGPSNPPIYWITTGALKDPYGTSLPAIQGSIANFGGSNWQAFSTSSGFLQWYYGTSSTGPWTNGASIVAGNTINGDLSIDSNPGGGVGNISEVYLGSQIVKVHVPAFIGNLNGIEVTPGIGITALNTGTAETWHSMTLINSWANVAGFAAAKYRIVASPPNSVEITGSINAAAATAAGFFTLPAGYRPASKVVVCSMGANASVPAGLSPWIQCDTSGNLSVQNTGAVGAAWQSFFHGFIPLDA